MDPVNITQNNRSLRPNMTRRVNRVSGVSSIRRYTVVEDTDRENFIKAVMDKSKEGYVVQGGVSVLLSASNRTTYYSQAMVKY